MTDGVQIPAPPLRAACANFVSSGSSRVHKTGSTAACFSWRRREGEAGRYRVCTGAWPVVDSTLSVIGDMSTSPPPVVQTTFTKDRLPQGRKAPTVP